MFDVDTDRTLIAAADLVNTSPGLYSAAPCPDRLTTVTELKEYLGRRDSQLPWPASAAERAQLEGVRELRAKVQSIWSARQTEDGAVEVLNQLLDGVGLRVGRGPDGRHRAEPVPASTELADVMTAGMATALQHLVVQEETARLRTCRGEKCDAVIIDLTRNRSRLFCDFGNCANRAHVRAYRARQAAERRTSSTMTKTRTAAETATETGPDQTRSKSSRTGAAPVPGDPSLVEAPRTPRRVKPSAAEKAAQIEVPTSQSATGAKEFRDRMREELMEKREKKERKKAKKARKE